MIVLLGMSLLFATIGFVPMENNAETLAFRGLLQQGTVFAFSWSKFL